MLISRSSLFGTDNSRLRWREHAEILTASQKFKILPDRSAKSLVFVFRNSCAVTTHYTVKPRENDPRWEGIEMERWDKNSVKQIWVAENEERIATEILFARKDGSS